MQYNYAERVQYMENSAIRELLKVAEQPHVISFAGGLPAPQLFPLEELRESYQKVLSSGDPSVLQYGSTEGYWPLREIISAGMKTKGIEAGPETILLTNGSQQGLDLIAKLFINPGDNVLLQNPSYLGAIQCFRSYQANFITVPVNEAGIDYAALEELIKLKHPKLFYLTPTYQNPTGSTLSGEDRQNLLRLASKYRLLVIEDDPYSELCYDNRQVPPIRAFARDSQVIYLGTFSKTLAPGLRLGWVTAEKSIISKLTIAKQGTDLHTSTLLQKTTYYYLTHFKAAEHILRIRRVYRERRDLMLKTLGDHLSNQAVWTEPGGGMFIWLTLPERYDTLRLLPAALAGQVAYVPGINFYVNQESSSSMRLNFSNPDPTQIEQGIKLLASIIKEAG